MLLISHIIRSSWFKKEDTFKDVSQLKELDLKLEKEKITVPNIGFVDIRYTHINNTMTIGFDPISLFTTQAQNPTNSKYLKPNKPVSANGNIESIHQTKAYRVQIFFYCSLSLYCYYERRTWNT